MIWDKLDGFFDWFYALPKRPVDMRMVIILLFGVVMETAAILMFKHHSIFPLFFLQYIILILFVIGKNRYTKKIRKIQEVVDKLDDRKSQSEEWFTT